MADISAAWFMSLTESVSSLGMAAREYRVAHRSAQTTTWQIDPARVLPLDGSVSVPDSTDFVRPHDEALWQLGQAYRKLGSRLHGLYENTALAYAHGTAEVLRAVLHGDCPRYISLGHRDGVYAPGRGELPDLSEGLGTWVCASRLDELRLDFQKRELAHDLTDATASTGNGLADSAFAYGELAEHALHFLLLAARSNRTPEEGQR
jgi:hypothetical protein